MVIYGRLLLSAGLLLVTSCWGKPDFEKKLGPKLRHPSLQKFVLQEERLDADLNSYRFTLGEQILLVREQTLGSSEEARFIEDREFLIASLYKTRRTPYPGEITATNECREDQLPKRYSPPGTVKTQVAFELWANNRLMYGQCTEEGRALRSIYVVLTCPQRKLGIEVKIFAPAKTQLPDPQKFVQDFQCMNLGPQVYL